jgi:hypothetical protein
MLEDVLPTPRVNARIEPPLEVADAYGPTVTGCARRTASSFATVTSYT